MLSRVSKHFKWEEAPACRYCLPSSISKTLRAGSVQAKPSSNRSSTGRAQSKPRGGRAGRCHGGKRGCAGGSAGTGGLPGAHASPQPACQKSGLSEARESARWVPGTLAAPGAAVGLGVPMNPQGCAEIVTAVLLVEFV